MIIALSSKKGGGKDETYKMINYISQEKGEMSIQNYNKWLLEEPRGVLSKDFFYKFENKKFASKIKEMVSILIGCGVEDLEDEGFKSTPLGDDWVRHSEEHVGTEPDGRKVTSLKTSQITPRLLLQLLGTEFGRQMVNEDVWVNSLFQDYDKALVHKVRSDLPHKYSPQWVVTDMRFPNEFDAVKARGGICVRVSRSKFTKDMGPFGKVTFPRVKCSPEHTSETALDNRTDWDYIIDNNGTKEELLLQVRDIMKNIYEEKGKV